MRRLSVVLLLGLAAALCPAATSAADAASAAMQATGSLQADFDNDGATDLAIGVLLEDIGGVLDAGAVNVLYGTGGGLSGTGNQVFWQGSPGWLAPPRSMTSSARHWSAATSRPAPPPPPLQPGTRMM